MVSIDCTQTYLGNSVQKKQLQKDIDMAQSFDRVIDVELTQADQKKSRIYAKTRSGEAIGLLKKRDWTFTDGDVFQVEGDRLLLVHLNTQTLMTLIIESHHSENALKLIHLGHTLGNHHYPIVVDTHKIYIQVPDDSTHLEAMIKTFNVEGLRVGYETCSSNQNLQFIHHSHA